MFSFFLTRTEFVWVMHYYSNKNKFKIKNDDNDLLQLDSDIKTNVMEMTKIQSHPYWMDQDNKK